MLSSRVDWFLVSDPTASPTFLCAEPGLFRNFASVKPSRAAVLRFAEKHGTLALWERFQTNETEEALGDSMTSWWLEIRGMGEVLRVWDAAKGRRPADHRFLREHFELKAHQIPDYVEAWYRPDQRLPAGCFRRLASSVPSWIMAEPLDESALLRRVRVFSFNFLRPGFRELPPFKQRRVLALAFLRRVVNDRIRAWVQGGLYDSEETVKPKQAHERPLALRLESPSLAGALWLQLAQSIDGDYRYQRCQACDRWIEISPKGSTRRREFCSATCRVRAWRRRPTTRVPQLGRPHRVSHQSTGSPQ